jgi:hypothetical protein
MKLLHFVSGSSIILAGWLAVTFVYHVPAQRYLKTEQELTTSASKSPSLVLQTAPPSRKSAALAFSVSP